jgi:tRNA (mo5U34)-methyltransferase
VAPVVDARDVPGLQERLDQYDWYHSIDVAPGVTTQGMFDNRHALSIIPFPDLRGKRCLDVGTCDGFYALHMERQGASEVIAVDLPDLSALDYPPEIRHDPTLDLSKRSERDRHGGFPVLKEVLDTKIEWRGCNVYDLRPDDLGRFDVVVVGSLLLHLRDPVRALDAVREVVRGDLVVVEGVHAPLTLRSPRRPVFELRGEGLDYQWWLGNERGIRHLLHVGGFTVEDVSPYFLLRFGGAWDLKQAALPRLSLRGRANWAMNAALARDPSRGHLHRAYRCVRRF